MKKLITVFYLLINFVSFASVTLPSSRPSGIYDPNDVLTEGQEHIIQTNFQNSKYDWVIIALDNCYPYETASDVAKHAFNLWKPGTSSYHNGLILVVSKSTPHSKDPRDLCRIMTGWDIIPELPDTTVINNVKHTHMMDHLPVSPFNALMESINEIHKITNDVTGSSGSSGSSDTSDSLTVLSWILGIIFGLLCIIGIIDWLSPGSNNDSNSSSYYSSSYSSKKKDKKDNSSSCGSSGCGSSGCGGGGCGGGGCGGGGCGS